MTDTMDTRPRTDMGRSQGKTWPYTVLSASVLNAELHRLAAPSSYADARAYSATIQPSNAKASEDRLAVQAWDLPDGIWTFSAVFDGHGDKHTAEHAVATIPGDLRAKLSAALADAGTGDLTAVIPGVIQAAFSTFEDGILAEFMALFPGGLPAVKNMSEDEIKAVINDGGANSTKVLRCMRGTTALVSLVDPKKENVWVASLGDCQAILGSEDASGTWRGEALGAVHNGLVQSEVERIRAEHPGEDEAVIGFRVLGVIMVTRALGDEHYKLDIEWTKRVFMLANPGFRLTFGAMKVTDYFPRCLTPPYLSSTADIRHSALDKATDRFLVLASDGLTDLISGEADPLFSQAHTDRIAAVVGGSGGDENLALRLLKDAMGGEDVEKCSRMLTVEMEGAWMDDTTVIVLRL